MILPPSAVLLSKRKPAIKTVGAIYARYSSRFQHSIEDQIRVCKDWAEKNGIRVPDDLIFVDRAVTGKSSRRQGLKDFQTALAENRAGVAIMFTTNRLYRKFYQSLAFVEEEIVDRGKRAVFVKSGPIDTDDKEHWRKLLHIHALMDEFVIQTIAAHVQSAHEGLLLQCRVTLHQGVTLGAVRSPAENGSTGRLAQENVIIQDRVVIHAHASVTSPGTVVGHDCVIGPNVQVSKNVAAGAIVALPSRKALWRKARARLLHEGLSM